MQKFDYSIVDMALRDPVQAYLRLLGYQERAVVFNSVASFSSLALNQIPQTQPLDQQITRRTWINNLTYTLALPNVNIGNIFQPQSMSFLKDSTGIAIRTTVMSGPRYVVTDTFTPLENYINKLHSQWPSGWQIYKNQQINTDFMLTAIPFGDASNTPPYNVTVTYNAFQFDDLSCDDLTCEQAQQGLCELGILTTKSLGGKTLFCPSFQS